MMTVQTDRITLAMYGRLLEYPNAGVHALAAELMAELADTSPEAAAHLDRFAAEAGMSTPEGLEEWYTRAFDLAPQAVPYLSVYIFGAEGTQRGQFMAGLQQSYAEHGFDSGHELPDHISLVLRYALLAPEEEWSALRDWCVPPPVKQMARDLERAQNPYRHLLHSLVAFLALSDSGEPDHV